LVILIAGASGFIGRHLAQALAARGHQVICAQRSPPADVTLPAGALPLRHQPADFTRDHDAAVWLPRLAGVDVVVNAVGILREHGSQGFEALHVRAPVALFQACAAAGVDRVVQISALGADEHAASGYHRSKKQADDALLALPLAGIVVQPSLVFGPDGASARLFTLLASLPVVPLPAGGRPLVQPIHIDDLLQALLELVQASEPPKGRLALVGPQAISLAAFLAGLRDSMGLPRAWLLDVPLALARLAARLGDRWPGSLLDSEVLGMLMRGNTADARDTARLLGRPPRPVSAFLPPAQAAQVRRSACLDWLLPILRLSVALVWIVTGVVSLGLYPVQDSYALLARVGAPAWAAPWLLFGAAGLDLALGLGMLALKRRRLLYWTQIGVMLFYTALISWRLPEFWLHPYGPILKNLPLLAAIWLLLCLEEER
jgi:uncharacterized protein YbjT (DUF2867 family)